MDASFAYEKNAHEFLRGRDESLIGAKIVQQWALTLPADAEVIEIACGGGYPITKQLVDAGFHVWAIDSSKTLISEFILRFPDVTVRCERFQESDLFARKFDSAIAIGLLFLLPESEQVMLVKKVARVLNPKARFLFTAPKEIGTWRDLNTGIECLSLGYDKYENILEVSGFRIIATYEDAGRNNYYEAEKRG